MDAERTRGPYLPIIALGLLVPFAVLLQQVLTHGWFVRHPDTRVLTGMLYAHFAHPTIQRVARHVTTVGSPQVMWFVITAVGAYLIGRRRIRMAAYLAATGVLGALANALLKSGVSLVVTGTATPPMGIAGHFPSGHVFSVTAVFGALLIIGWPSLSQRTRALSIAVYVLLIPAVAFTRLALFVHVLSDTIGGAYLGGAWLLAMTAAFRAWPAATREPRER